MLCLRICSSIAAGCMITLLKGGGTSEISVTNGSAPLAARANMNEYVLEKINNSLVWSYPNAHGYNSCT